MGRFIQRFRSCFDEHGLLSSKERLSKLDLGVRGDLPVEVVRRLEEEDYGGAKVEERHAIALCSDDVVFVLDLVLLSQALVPEVRVEVIIPLEGDGAYVVRADGRH